MTPSVRRQEYTPKLSPEIEQLSRAAADHSMPGAVAAAGGITPGNGTYALYNSQDQQQPLVHPNELSASRIAKHYLPTTGDLFAQPDQYELQVGTRLQRGNRDQPL